MNTSDILRKTPMPSMETMNIQSEIIDPVVATKSLVRFQLARNGILRSGSVIKFKVSSQTDSDCFFPLKTGCFSLFNRVELMLGSKRIQTVDKSALYNTIKRQTQSQDYKYGVDLVQKGCVDSLCSSTSNDGTLMLSSGVETGDNSTIPSQYRITQTNPSEFSVQLDELFPMLHDLSLPLGHLRENLFINLHLNKQDRTTNAAADLSLGPIGLFAVGYNGSQAVEADLTSFQLIADTLYFSQEREQQLADAMMDDQGLTVVTDDVITVVNQQSQVTNPVTVPPTTGERVQSIQLALAGLSVKSVLVADRNLAPSTVVNDCLLGPYTSQAYARPNSFQLRLNDLLVYPQPVTNEMLKLKEVSDVFGEDYNVNSAEYSFNDVSTKSASHLLENKIISVGKTFMGHSEALGLTGQSHYEGVNVAVPRSGRQGVLSKGTVVLERTTYPSVAISTLDKRELTVFCGTEKIVSFRQGQLITVS